MRTALLMIAAYAIPAGQIGHTGLIAAGLVLTVAGLPLGLKAHSRLTTVPEPSPVAA
jgi:hypothetical protein